MQETVYDARSLKEMTEIGNVICIEAVGTSLYAEIENEIRIAKEQDSIILGAIVIA